MSPRFELTAIGGPWGRRVARRRAWIDELPWHDPIDAGPEARWIWTQTAFSEYASAAAFADIAGALAAANAPIDLIAAAGDFVVDEIVHTEAAARLVTALGGAVDLEVDLTRLVRPAVSDDPVVAAAERVVRTSCVGEALTVPILKASRQVAGSALVGEALAAIVADEGSHAQLGWWFLDWAEAQLDDASRAHLGRVAGAAIRGFAPLLHRDCSPSGGLGGLSCDGYDSTFAAAVARHVVAPLAARGIEVPAADRELIASRAAPATAGA